MAIITLTTDLGTKDHYVASIKGALLSQCEDARIIDISHDIPPFNILQASFVIKNCFYDFPPGTIHIIGIDPEVSTDTPHIAVKYKDHYFIGADNGLFSLVFETQPEKIVELDIKQDTDLMTFPTKDVFVKAACHLARGGTLEVIGKEKERLRERTLFRAVSEENIIRGMVIYVDHYGNIITNITENIFTNFRKGRDFTIFFRQSDYNISSLSSSYKDVVEGERLALFGASGNLEIAINQGNASKLFGINQGDTIRIEFR